MTSLCATKTLRSKWKEFAHGELCELCWLQDQRRRRQHISGEVGLGRTIFISTTMLNLKVATQVTLKEATSRRRVATNRDVVSVNEYLLANFDSKSSKGFQTKKEEGIGVVSLR